MRRKKVSEVKTVWWKRARSAITGRFMKIVDAMLALPTSIVEKVRRREGQNTDEK